MDDTTHIIRTHSLSLGYLLFEGGVSIHGTPRATEEMGILPLHNVIHGYSSRCQWRSVGRVSLGHWRLEVILACYHRECHLGV